MSDKKDYIDDDDLLKRLESDRNKDIGGSGGSSSLNRIIEEDIKNNLPPTKLIPIVLTIIGGLYLGIVQIYNFTNSLDGVHGTAASNTEQIQELSDNQYQMRSELNELIYDNNTALTRRINDIDSIINDIVRDSDYNLTTTNDRVNRIKNSINRIDNRLSNDVRDLKTKVENNSNRVSEIETTVRVLEAEREFLNR